ncbi:Septum formation protein Maf [hydrothermal vent metagenome]|uniref:Septum formation protein Maf n=1 Tax=hydrothermal vent metagenome TaxID=652676 RepID=A0A1W1CGR4_9ZZZZ
MICLCSSSETRALLLKKFNIDFIQKSPKYDEDKISTTIAEEFVYQASLGKLEAGIKEFGLDIPLLSADTVIVSSDREILRKARNIEDARRILNIQSGSKISIISSVHYKSEDILFSNISTTNYDFYKFDKDDLEDYLNSQLWNGKAGGCMVEGFCKKYIKSVDGLESNAMGLQVEIISPWIN